jgi:hypothetical protein
MFRYAATKCSQFELLLLENNSFCWQIPTFSLRGIYLLFVRKFPTICVYLLCRAAKIFGICQQKQLKLIVFCSAVSERFWPIFLLSFTAFFSVLPVFRWHLSYSSIFGSQ